MSSFDEIEILVPGDGPSIIPSVYKMKQRKTTLLKHFIRCQRMHKCVMSIHLLHEGFKSGC